MSKSINFTEEERDKLLNAIKFYVHEVTHNPEEMNGCAGLPEGKERTILVNIIRKFENVTEDKSSIKREMKGELHKDY